MTLVISIWLASITIASVSSAWYVRRYKRPDLPIALYVIYLAMSQVIASKIATFNLGLITVSAPAAVLIFPFTFQIIDIVNEAFGRQETHRMIFIAFISQVLMTFFLWIGTALPPAPFWKAQEAWTAAVSLVPRITAASWVAFLVSENLDAVLYAWIRKMTKGRHLWVRNLFSDIPSLALDSIIFVSLAFFGVVPVLPLLIGQLTTKLIVGVVDTPFIYLSRYILVKR